MIITYYKKDGTVIADYDPTVLNNLDVGSYYAIVSLANATNYNDATGRVDFDIIAVAPTINQAIEVVYNQPNMNGFFTTDMNISNITFAGSYNTEGTIVLDATQLTVGTNNYNYTFTPNSNNYTTATGTVSIIVKATVQFKDGDTVLETQYIAKDATISSFPSLTKMDGILEKLSIHHKQLLLIQH